MLAITNIAQYELCTRASAGGATALLWYKISCLLHKPCRVSDWRAFLKYLALALLLVAPAAYKRAIVFGQGTTVSTVNSQDARWCTPSCSSAGYGPLQFYNNTNGNYTVLGSGIISSPDSSCALYGGSSCCTTMGVDTSALSEELAGQVVGFSARVASALSGSAMCSAVSLAEMCSEQQAFVNIIANGDWGIFVDTNAVASSSSCGNASQAFNMVGSIYYLLQTSNRLATGVRCTYRDTIVSGTLVGLYGDHGWAMSVIPQTTSALPSFMPTTQYRISSVTSLELSDQVGQLAHLYGMNSSTFVGAAGSSSGMLKDIQSLIALSRHGIVEDMGNYPLNASMQSVTVMQSLVTVASTQWLAASILTVLLPWAIVMLWFAVISLRLGCMYRYFDLTPIGIARMCQHVDVGLSNALFGSCLGGKPVDPQVQCGIGAVLRWLLWCYECLHNHQYPDFSSRDDWCV